MVKKSLINTAITITESLILINKRIYIPLLLRKEIYSQNHNLKTIGHPGINHIKTNPTDLLFSKNEKVRRELNTEIYDLLKE